MSANEEILVTRSSMPSFEEYCEEIRCLWDSHWLTNRGEKHKQLEEDIQSYLGVNHMTLFVNGHSALECILETMELGSDGRDEVITTPFTFASTTHAIVRKGLKPVFCDIRLDDCTIDANKIEALITDKTCAIVPVHVYGNICDVDLIEDIANRNNLKVIYDAAHAFGAKKNGIGVGNFGDASMFSFHATKVFNTIEGGAIAHSDGALSERLAQWRNFGITGPESCIFIGGNSKMNEFAAAMGICNLHHVDEEIEKRSVVVQRYFDRLNGMSGVQIFIPSSEITPNYAYMPVVFDSNKCGFTRDDVYKALSSESVFARKYFYPIVSDLECYRDTHDSSLTPIAKWVGDNVLTLPMYADLSIETVDRICNIIDSLRK